MYNCIRFCLKIRTRYIIKYLYQSWHTEQFNVGLGIAVFCTRMIYWTVTSNPNRVIFVQPFGFTRVLEIHMIWTTVLLTFPLSIESQRDFTKILQKLETIVKSLFYSCTKVYVLTLILNSWRLSNISSAIVTWM